MVKALFWWKIGPFPQTGNGEVDIGDKELVVKLPLALSGPFSKKLKDELKDSIKAGLAFAALGFGGQYYVKGTPIKIPFEYVKGVNLVERSMGVMGKRRFIELKLSIEGKGFTLTFAPYKGTISREYLTEEWLSQFREALEGCVQAAPPERAIEKPAAPPQEEHARETVAKGEEEEKGVKETVAGESPVEAAGVLRFDVGKGVFVRSPVVRFKVETQGVSEDFKANGSFDVVDRGFLTLSEAINLLADLPDSYPPELAETGEFCPVNMIVTRGEGDYVSIFLESDRSFAVYRSSTNETKSGLTKEDVVRVLEEFYI